MDTTFIYALTEPGTKNIRYFGKANDPRGRRIGHVHSAKDGEKWHAACWIRKLLTAGQRPDVHVLCEVPRDDFARFECAFIALGRQAGFDLTNCSDGGEDPPHPKGVQHPMFGKKHKPESLAKMSATQKGKKRNPKTRANLRVKKGGSSIFHGIGRDAHSNRWRAWICVDNKTINLGRFSDEIEAAKAYDAAAKIYHGEYAKLNFP